MDLRLPLGLLALLATALAGCSGTTDGGEDAALEENGHALDQNFDAEADGSVPQGWVAYEGDWGVGEGDAGHARVMRGAGSETAEVSSLVAPAGNFQDFEMLVKFNMTQGDAGAGVVFHWQDEENYQIVRYSIRESGWDLFTMVDDNREKQPSARMPDGPLHDVREWVTLRVTSEGGHVKAFDGATQVISYDLQEEAALVGGVGIFLRADAHAMFDDFEVELLHG